MDLFTGVIVYIMIWWIVIFAVLPWGVKPLDNPNVGEVNSAPEKPDLKKKFLITSLISLVILGIVVTLVEIDIIDFRVLSQGMMDSAQ